MSLDLYYYYYYHNYFFKQVLSTIFHRPKQRLSVSFAIAQSSVLAIFEARIERKVEEYKYIPETLAAYGKVHLTERQLGMMIGDVFVIRHDVNLHTEILGMAHINSFFTIYST